MEVEERRRKRDSKIKGREKIKRERRVRRKKRDKKDIFETEIERIIQMCLLNR